MNQGWADTLAEKSRRVDAALARFLESHREPAVENLHDGVRYALGLDTGDPAARGKRIRPALCLIACEALEGDCAQAMPAAIAFELMHNFFLVHDDIEDNDRFRRGRASVWARFGLEHGVNIGDFLLTKVFEAILDAAPAFAPPLRLRLLDLIVETLRFTHVGQAQDMNARAQTDVTLERYMEIVTHKTGYYFAAPIVAGALVAGAPEETLSAIRRLGRYAGPLFQITDDLIDLTSGKGREDWGSDIREGKRSFLAAYTAAKASPEERSEMFRILDLPRAETPQCGVEWVRDLFENYGAAEAGRALCRDLTERAREEMASAPQRLVSALFKVFEGLLERRM